MAREAPTIAAERASKLAKPRELVRPPKVHEQIAAILESEISDGTYRVGAALPSERTLMERFNVGRPAVRQALVALERIGLVSLRSGKRAQVVEPSASLLLEDLSVAVKHFMSTPDGVNQLQEARLLFEVAIVRGAARCSSRGQVNRLEQVLHRNRKAIGRRHQFEDTDVAFHFTIVEMLRNPVLNAIHRSVAAWLKEQRAGALRERGADLRAYRFHAAIFEAIRDHDPDRGETAMREHLEDVIRGYWATSIAKPALVGAAPPSPPNDDEEAM
jgi:GntR family transcriptional regulator, sialic acid-inducible nan operon repressor